MESIGDCGRRIRWKPTGRCQREKKKKDDDVEYIVPSHLAQILKNATVIPAKKEREVMEDNGECIASSSRWKTLVIDKVQALVTAGLYILELRTLFFYVDCVCTFASVRPDHPPAHLQIYRITFVLLHLHGLHGYFVCFACILISICLCAYTCATL